MVDKFYIDGPQKTGTIRRYMPDKKKVGKMPKRQPVKRRKSPPTPVNIYNPHFKQILVPVDLGSNMHAHLHLGASLALQNQATVTLMAVIGNAPTGAESPYIYRQAEFDLMNIRQEYFAPESLVQTQVHMGDPANKIVLAAGTGHFDLVVMGTHGRKGLAHLVLGSVAEKVLRKSRCPVLTVRSHRRPIKPK